MSLSQLALVVLGTGLLLGIGGLLAGLVLSFQAIDTLTAETGIGQISCEQQCLSADG